MVVGKLPSFIRIILYDAGSNLSSLPFEVLLVSFFRAASNQPPFDGIAEDP